jgi:hypothetical protein
MKKINNSWHDVANQLGEDDIPSSKIGKSYNKPFLTIIGVNLHIKGLL